MSKEYNVDDILSEIKAKKSRQSRPAGPGASQAAPPARGPGAPAEGRQSPSEGHPAPTPAPQKLHPRSDFQIDRKEQFATLPQETQLPPQREAPSPGRFPEWELEQPAAPEEEPFPASSSGVQRQPEAFRQTGEPWAEEPTAPAPPPRRPQHPAPAQRPAFRDFDLEESLSQPEEGLFSFPQGEGDHFSPPEEDEPLFQTPAAGSSGRESRRLNAFDPERFQEVSAPKDKRRGKRTHLQDQAEEVSFASPPSAGDSSAAESQEEFPDLVDYQKYFSSLDSVSGLDDSLTADAYGKEDPSPAAGQEDPFGPGVPNPNIFATTTFSMPDTSAAGFGQAGAGADPGPGSSPGARSGAGGKFKVNLPPDLGGQGGLFPPEEPEEPRGGFFRRRSREEEPVSQLGNADIPVPEDEEDGELEDYSSPKDKEAVIQDMRNIKLGLITRTLLMLLVFLLSLYLTLAARNIAIGDGLLPLPTFMQPELHTRAYMIVATVVAALGAVICSNTVGGGILSLLKFQADTDTLPALSLLGVMAQGICYIIRPSLFNVQSLDSNLYLFFPVALLLLLCNLVGKLLVILRIQNNFKLVASDRVKHSVNFLRNKDLVRDLSKGLSMEEYAIAYPEKARFLTGFLDNSYSDDPAEQMSRIVSPICLVAGVGLAVLSYLFHKDIVVAVTTFTAVTCICAPVTSTIAANLPLLRLSRKLIPMGAMVAGYSSVESFSHTEAVVMGASEIFRPENVVLHGIKAFDEGKIDSVILDAASVVCASNGMLSAVFGKIIGSNKAMLKKVENITYEDSMGLTAWVDGKRVLIGNRELMMNHGIEVPSNDYEMRYVKDSKNIIYLSNSGELSAMFVISYNPNSAMREELDRLADRGMYLIVETSDPNITAEKVRDAYQFPIEQLKILPARHHGLYMSLTAERERSSAKIGYMGSSRTMVKAILGCMAVKTSISQAVMIQLIALVVGYALIALFSLMGNLGLITIGHIILYQILWGAITMLAPNLKKL